MAGVSCRSCWLRCRRGAQWCRCCSELAASHAMMLACSHPWGCASPAPCLPLLCGPGLHHWCGQDVQAAGQAHALQGLHAHDRAQPQPAARRGALGRAAGAAAASPAAQSSWGNGCLAGWAACGSLGLQRGCPPLLSAACWSRSPACCACLRPLCRRRLPRSSRRCSLTSTSCTTS